VGVAELADVGPDGGVVVVCGVAAGGALRPAAPDDPVAALRVWGGPIRGFLDGYCAGCCRLRAATVRTASATALKSFLRMAPWLLGTLAPSWMWGLRA
jgi:hypothetical protein